MIKVGISQCLTGAKVRYDGGHRNNKFCNQELSQLFEFVSFCPEVGIGLPIPRKTIRLVGDVDQPRAEFSDGSGEDLALQLKNFADTNQSKLEESSGFIFCKASPSCGTQRVKVYNDKGHSQSVGVGIFAARVNQLFPNLPIEDDGRLNDPQIRDSFIKRVYIYDEWKSLRTELTLDALFKFHARHKFTLLSHCQKTYREVGALVASANKKTVENVADLYFSKLMGGLSNVSTRRNTTNVLMHLQGFLKKRISQADKAELRQCIMDYNNGVEPILSPLRLLKHHFGHHPNSYIAGQSFLNPYPKQLGIRVKML
ncbi:MAG: DUF1722 domain-containing protein [Kangiellaceae bacterium]|nr:DUF1722 domain-containing protein [Kangiellaceae bacterium]MCW9015648.1 DUF1722 domain-containing protein [Kangiellaceae bacterium]